MSNEIGSGGLGHAGQLKDPVTGEWRYVKVGEILECIDSGLYSISYGSMHEFAGYHCSNQDLIRIKGLEGPYWLTAFKIAAAQNGPTAIITSGATVRSLEVRPEDLQGDIVCVPEEHGGLRYNEGKLRYDLLPPDAVQELVEVLTKGAQKYPERNWEKGMDWSKCLASLKRHLASWEMGTDNDAETGRMHMAHVMWNAMALVTYALRGVGADDRPKIKGQAV